MIFTNKEWQKLTAIFGPDVFRSHRPLGVHESEAVRANKAARRPVSPNGEQGPAIDPCGVSAVSYLSPLDPPDDDDTHGAPDPACLPDVCECDDGLVRVDTWLGFPVYLDCSCPLARPVRDDSLPFDV